MRWTYSYSIGAICGVLAALYFGYKINVVVGIILGVVIGIIIYKLWRKLENVIHEKVDKPINQAISNTVFGSDLNERVSYMTQNIFNYSVRSSKQIVLDTVKSELETMADKRASTTVKRLWNGVAKILPVSNEKGFVVNMATVISVVAVTGENNSVLIQFLYKEHTQGAVMKNQIAEILSQLRVRVYNAAKKIDPDCTETVTPTRA
jgi:hypothetical protein